MNKKYKKFFSLTALLMLAIFALTSIGCGGTASTEKPKEEQKYTLRMNYSFAPANDKNDPKYLASEIFAQRVNEKTNGRVEIKIYYNNQLIPYNQALDAMTQGTIDMNGGGAYWGEILPTQDFGWLPYGFYGSDHMRHLMRETEIGDISRKALESKGVKVLFYYPLGDQGMLSKQPITKIEDAKGKLVRLGTGLWTNWYKSIGAAPVSISGPELYEALMRGTIDVAMYPVYTLKTTKLIEVAKNATLPAVLEPSTCVNYISLKAWNKLPKDLQAIVEEVSLQIEQEAIEQNNKFVAEAEKWAKENGANINYLTKEEYQMWVDSAQVAWDEFAAKSPETKRMVEILKEDRKTYLDKNPEIKKVWDARFKK